MQYKTISLGDETLFDFISQKNGWKKEFYKKHNTYNKSDYPVYTASNKAVAFVSINDDSLIEVGSDSIFSFASNGDGSAGKNFVIHQQDFYISNDRTVIKIKDNSLLSEYVEYSLRAMKEDYNFCFSYKATQKNSSLVTFDIPIDDSDSFDINKQKAIIKKFKNVKLLQTKAKNFSDDLSQAIVPISDLSKNLKKRSLSIEDESIFHIDIGERVLKKDRLDKGVITYSANVNKPFGCIKESNLKEFDKPSLIWGIDGIFDWGYIPEETKFATTDHCGRLTINHDDLYPKYIFYALKSTKDQYGFDRTYRASLKNMKEVVSVGVPIDKDGNFDMDAQIDIAERYEKLEDAKNKILEQLESLSSVQVSLDIS